jgi:hypothetical protein
MLLSVIVAALSAGLAWVITSIEVSRTQFGRSLGVPVKRVDSLLAEPRWWCAYNAYRYAIVSFVFAFTLAAQGIVANQIVLAAIPVGLVAGALEGLRTLRSRQALSRRSEPPTERPAPAIQTSEESGKERNGPAVEADASEE